MLIFALVSSKELASLINHSFLNLKLKYYFLISFDSFYDDEFNSLAFSTFAAVISIIIPVFISLYDNARAGNTLSKKYIQKYFNFENILFIMAILLSGLISRNSLFVFFLIILLCFYIYKNTKRYFELLFYKKTALSNFIKESFNSRESESINFANEAEKIENEIKVFLNCDDDINFKNKSIDFTSKKNIKTIHFPALRTWIKKLVKNQIFTEAADFYATDDKIIGDNFDIKMLIKANVSYDPEQRYVTIRIELSEHFSALDSINLELIKNELSKEYKEKLFTYSEREFYDDILEDYDKYLYSLLKQNNLSELTEALNLIEIILKDKNNLNKKFLENISYLNYKIYNIYNNFEHSNATSKIFLKYWETFFEATLVPKSEPFVRNALEDLANAIKNGFISKIDQEDLDRRITSLLKYEKLNRDFVFKYINGLITVAISFLRQHEPDEENAIKFLTYIQFLGKDIKRSSKYKLSKYGQEEIEEILKMTDQGLVLAIAFITTEFKNTITAKQRFYSLINQKTYLQTIQQLYIKDEDRWDMFSWRQHKFDRHGSGAGWSFSAHHFFKANTIDYLISTNFPYYEICNFSIKENAIYLFKEILKEFEEKALQTANQSIVDELKKCLQKATFEKESNIIKSSLDKNEVFKFLTECENTYKQEFKISSLVEKNISEKINDANSLGHYTLIPKEYFFKESNTVFSGLADYGRYLAIGENREIIKKLDQEIKFPICSHQDFFKYNLPKILSKNSGKTFIYIGKSYNFTSEAKDWSSLTCRYNDEIKYVDSEDSSNNDKIESISFGLNRYAIHLVNSDKLKHDYLIAVDKTDLSLSFDKYSMPSDFSITSENNSFFEIKEIQESTAREMIEKNQYRTKTEEFADKLHELQLLVSLKIFICLDIRINNKNISGFKIKRPRDIDYD